MSFKFRKTIKAFTFLTAALYPAMIFYLLVIKKFELRHISIFVIAFALVLFIFGTSKKKALEIPAVFFQ